MSALVTDTIWLVAGETDSMGGTSAYIDSINASEQTSQKGELSERILHVYFGRYQPMS